MLADTLLIRALGGAYTAHAAELAAIAAALRSVPSPATALGPVGDRFLAAFADAVTDQVAAAAALGDETQTAGATAGQNAASYDAAGHRAAHLLPRV
ncbi:hypothetical protein [Mycolicibacterium sp. XJ870]